MATGLCGTCGGSVPGCGCYVTAVASGGARVTGDGSSGSPFAISVDNRQQIANPVSNASFAVWQRGASRVAAASYATIGPDRWNIYRTGLATGATWTQQSSGDSQGSGYCARVQRDNTDTSTAALYTAQSFETKNSIHHANRTVTVSFRARKGANYSAASANLQMVTYSGTGTDQSVVTGFTGTATLTNANYVLTSSWATYSVTVAVGSTATQLGVVFAFTPVGTAGAADYYEIKDVRVDDGSYAIAHVPLPYAADLADCQRLFWRAGGTGTDSLAFGFCASSTIAVGMFTPPVPMRAVPTLAVSNVVKFSVSDSVGGFTSTAVALSGTYATTPRIIAVAVTSSGMTQTRPAIISAVDSAGYLDFSADL